MDGASPDDRKALRKPLFQPVAAPAERDADTGLARGQVSVLLSFP